jgi:adenosine kinase
MLSDRTGLSSADISKKVKGLIVTLGEHGCEVWVDGVKTIVEPVKANNVVDPTGCGDAFRGALLFGLEKGWPLAKCAKLGNQLGAIKITQRGGQNYQLNLSNLGL